MPGFAQTLEQGFQVEGVSTETNLTWAMVAYLESLIQPREPAGVPSGAEILVRASDNRALLSDPRAWDGLPSVAVSLQPLWQRRHAARSVQVRAAWVGDQVAVCLDWPDETFDAMGDGLHSFTDAVAVMFAMTDTIPPIQMGQRAAKLSSGDRPPQSLVNIWQWRADRQLNANEHRLHDVVGPASSAGVPADLYMFKKGDRVRGPITEHDPNYVPAWDVGNPKADPALLSRSVLESNAAGFGTLTLQSVKDQGVAGQAVWSQGRWRALMVRDVKPGGDGDVDLATGAQSGRRIPLAVAVWNGLAGDRNGTKLVSGWHWLVLQRP